MVESEQHQLHCSLDLFVSKEKKRMGVNWWVREEREGGEERSPHAGLCAQLSWAAPLPRRAPVARNSEFSGPQGLWGPAILTTVFYQLRREVLPNVMK